MHKPCPETVLCCAVVVGKLEKVIAHLRHRDGHRKIRRLFRRSTRSPVNEIVP